MNICWLLAFMLGALAMPAPFDYTADVLAKAFTALAATAVNSIIPQSSPSGPHSIAASSDMVLNSPTPVSDGIFTPLSRLDRRQDPKVNVLGNAIKDIASLFMAAKTITTGGVIVTKTSAFKVGWGNAQTATWQTLVDPTVIVSVKQTRTVTGLVGLPTSLEAAMTLAAASGAAKNSKGVTYTKYMTTVRVAAPTPTPPPPPPPPPSISSSDRLTFETVFTGAATNFRSSDGVEWRQAGTDCATGQILMESYFNNPGKYHPNACGGLIYHMKHRRFQRRTSESTTARARASSAAAMERVGPGQQGPLNEVEAAPYIRGKTHDRLKFSDRFRTFWY